MPQVRPDNIDCSNIILLTSTVAIENKLIEDLTPWDANVFKYNQYKETYDLGDGFNSCLEVTAFLFPNTEYN